MLLALTGGVGKALVVAKLNNIQGVFARGEGRLEGTHDGAR